MYFPKYEMIIFSKIFSGTLINQSQLKIGISFYFARDLSFSFLSNSIPPPPPLLIIKDGRNHTKWYITYDIWRNKRNSFINKILFFSCLCNSSEQQIKLAVFHLKVIQLSYLHDLCFLINLYKGYLAAFFYLINLNDDFFFFICSLKRVTKSANKLKRKILPLLICGKIPLCFWSSYVH